MTNEEFTEILHKLMQEPEPKSQWTRVSKRKQKRSADLLALLSELAYYMSGSFGSGPDHVDRRVKSKREHVGPNRHGPVYASAIFKQALTDGFNPLLKGYILASKQLDQ